MAQTFDKRPGATDRGRDYEHLYIASIILKLLQDTTIEDFHISSNDKKFGSFDDVVITIKYHNKPIPETHAIQLKQSKNKILRSKDLTAKKGNFSICEYFEDFKENLKSMSLFGLRTVLYTNCKAQIDNDPILILSEDSKVKIWKAGQNDLLGTNPQGSCFKFQAEDPQLQEFLQGFSLYTAQAGVDQIERITLKMFCELFKSDESVFKEYVSFIVKWSIKEGNKEKLDRKWMLEAIALRVVSPFLKPLCFSNERVITDKESIFREAVSQFPVTNLQKKSYKRLKNLWRDGTQQLDLSQVNHVRNKYQLALEYVKNSEELTKEDKEVSKLMWLLKNTPLVVEEYLGFNQTLQLCEIRRVITLTNTHLESTINFQNLSNLRNYPQVYDKILTTFTFSLEGQEETKLKHLMHYNQKFRPKITSDGLLQMLDCPLLIGQRTKLPPCHIPRTFWSILIDSQCLQKLEGTVIITTEPENFDKIKIQFFNFKLFELTPGLTTFEKSSRGVLYLTTKECLWSENQTTPIPYYHFRYRNEYLEWISSTNIETLKHFRLDHDYTNPISESEIFLLENGINLVCANSGMGKSILMRSLKNSLESSIWTVLIYASIHARHVKTSVEKFLEHVWNSQCNSYNDQEKEILKTYIENKQLRIVWDGLDEVSRESLEDILELVQQISKKGIKQWLTARNNLKKFLEGRFQTFSRRIRQFDGREQRLFIQQRLQLNEDELVEVLKKIKVNVEPFSNSDILGIPLQIYMLTELYTKTLLDESLTLLDLYENFVLHKFQVFYTKKLKIDLGIDQNYQKFEEDMKTQIENYKRVAFELHLGPPSIFSHLVSRDDFLETLAKKGDSFGFISEVSGDVPKFVHNSFGEYFAALYLLDHEPTKAKDPNFIQMETCNNIRFFLDLMLVKTSKAHIAVLYKNSTLLDLCTEAQLNQKDSIDRGTLELSCAWSRQYEVAKIQKLSFGRFNIHSKYVADDTSRRLHYRTISKSVSRIIPIDLRLRKLLLLLPFLIPLYSKNEIECGIMLLYYSVIFDHVIVFNYADNIPLLKKSYNNFDAKYLLSVALIYQSHNCLQEFLLRKQYCQALRHDLNILLYACRTGNENMFSLLVRNVVDINKVAVFACAEGRLENVQFLMEKNLKIEDKNRSFLHYACDNEVDGLAIVQFLTRTGGDVNGVDAKGRMPLHYACMNCRFATKISWLLIEKESEVNSVDVNNRTPLHYACDNEDGYHTAMLLLTKGAKMDVADVTGRMPIHYACMNWNQGFDLVRLLVDYNAKMDAPDQNGRTPLHYACRNYFRGGKITQLLIEKGVGVHVPDLGGGYPVQYACESGTTETAKVLIKHSDLTNVIHYACKNYHHGCDIVQFLTTKGVDLNAVDKHGRTPLHYACKFSRPETVKFLIENKVKVNVCDQRGRLPLHYACVNKYHSAEIVGVLIQQGSRVGVADKDGRLPIHLACEKSTVYAVKLIVEKSVMSMKVPGPNGLMPMHYACRNYNHGCDMVKYLTSEGAPVSESDRDGRVPMHYACVTGNIYTVEVLLEMGAKIDVRDGDGCSPADHARKEGNYNVMALLEDYAKPEFNVL